MDDMRARLEAGDIPRTRDGAADLAGLRHGLRAEPGNGWLADLLGAVYDAGHGDGESDRGAAVAVAIEHSRDAAELVDRLSALDDFGDLELGSKVGGPRPGHHHRMEPVAAQPRPATWFTGLMKQTVVARRCRECPEVDAVVLAGDWQLADLAAVPGRLREAGT